MIETYENLKYAHKTKSEIFIVCVFEKRPTCLKNVIQTNNDYKLQVFDKQLMCMEIFLS